MRTVARIGMPPSAGDVFPGIRFFLGRYVRDESIKGNPKAFRAEQNNR
ncbi:Uncharacterised protein [Slackia heliotrinireducens]|uniref:Uncharacterized protein n=1 Tax=Slackia heliotrinireducens (strain ATCC 29202 / DSM 20476 / NCTC 11029 / RHS 1) TaxID=471855 RepID=C7N2K4_SLAHD|nr:hypothetical protein Shel_25050 [Slackia heliotrinireducens DSM 20476]VEH02890.1 Uncharacterised protein [Slackia heliotrinireducens]